MASNARTAVVLAAGRGTRLADVAAGLPKCMVPVAGRPMIDRMVERIAEAGIERLVVVTGFEAETLTAHLAASAHPLARAATCVWNERFFDWGNFYSLLVAEPAIGGGGFLALDGDVVLDATLLPRLLAAPGPIALAVERRADLGAEEMKVRVDADGRAVELNKRMDPAVALGEFVGIERVDAEATGEVFATLRSLIERGETGEYYERAFELMMQRGAAVQVADITGCQWGEVDDARDLAAASALVGRLS